MSMTRGCTILLFLLAPRILLGQDEGRDHDDGFFLRLSAGAGFATTKLSAGSPSIKLSGETGDLNFAIGGIVSPNLALHATLYGWLVQDPDVEVSGVSSKVSEDLDLSAFGLGLTYYFMPVNIYVSGSAGLGKLSVKGQGNVGETKQGPVFDLTAGKEWWVGSNWGLGVAATTMWFSVPENGVDGNWNGVSFAIRFTATLN